MKNEEYILLSESEIEELKEAANLIEKVLGNITIEHEEFSAIKTSLAYLNNAINYKKKFLS